MKHVDDSNEQEKKNVFVSPHPCYGPRVGHREWMMADGHSHGGGGVVIGGALAVSTRRPPRPSSLPVVTLQRLDARPRIAQVDC